jgi:hypothetical protein
VYGVWGLVEVVQLLQTTELNSNTLRSFLYTDPRTDEFEVLEYFGDYAIWRKQKPRNNESPVLSYSYNPFLPSMLGCHSYLGRIGDILLESLVLQMAEPANCEYQFITWYTLT